MGWHYLFQSAHVFHFGTSERYSHDIKRETKEFAINLSNEQLAATDWCGVRSQRFDKFKEMGLTPMKAGKIDAPLIKESPVNLECVVKQIVELGSHNMFISEIVAVNVDNELINPKSDTLELFKARLINYTHGFYYKQGAMIGRFGFSVRKK